MVSGITPCAQERKRIVYFGETPERSHGHPGIPAVHSGHRARVPRVVNEPRAVLLALARQQLAFSANVPSYRHTWALARR